MTRTPLTVDRRATLAAILIVLVYFAVELSWHRPPICPCGSVKLWTGAVWSAENSQQISDWYSLSHIIHGFLFYGAAWLILPGRARLWALPLAVVIEGSWELLENSPIIIDRYRAATAAVGYSGDSILNSMSDIGMMVIGFALARRIPVWSTVAIALFFELLALAAIRDNLTLNVLMLTYPVDAIRVWQAGG
ncbi:DUF2585 domain-containing protein [Sphingomonas bacterium]|uniref:DUF2585 domain-containing protein n=1 Tax=Sphingomonas bacterium TaxID=1895847 RepID=UPI002625241C|nr:DUF2585 domain-containing protein [Sphingomonas bacterium]MDB5677692.1 hypothetical protein [Sphingomonas bacterium]